MAVRLGNRTLAVLVLVLAAATAVLAWFAWDHYRGTLTVRLNSTDRQAALEKIDRNISLGLYEQAAGQINNLLEKSGNASLFLQLARRAYLIGDVSGNYSLLESAARTGHEAYEGREDFAALLAYALLRLEQPDEALMITGKYKPFRGPLIPVIHGEALLANRSGKDNGIEEYGASSLHTLALELENEALLADALLLYLVSADMEKADDLTDLLHNGIGDERYPLRDELLYQLFSEQGEYHLALDLLEKGASFSRAERELLSADIMIRVDNKKGAARHYRNYISDFPGESWIPYVNLQLLEEALPAENPLFRLDSGIKYFPEEGDFLLWSALYCTDRRFFGAAEQFLTSYELSGGTSPIAPLLRERISGNAHPERYGTLIRRLLEGRGSGMQEAGHGVWFFYGLRAKKEITRLADYALENWGEEGWTFFLQALSAVLEGNQERALTFFEKSWELDAALWEAAYNAGVIYLVQGRNIDAGNWLKKAESSVPTSDKNSIALIYTKFAEIELAAGRRDDARRYIRYALEISPANPSARSFHSMLDESYP
jgi:hypothetical protein